MLKELEIINPNNNNNNNNQLYNIKLSPEKTLTQLILKRNKIINKNKT